MKRNTNWIVTAVAAFAGGYLAGMLFAPQSGRDLRRSIASRASEPAHWMEGRLHEIERQLSELERELRATSAEFGDRLREATQRAVSHYVPENPEPWRVERSEVTRELPGLPR